MQTTCFKATRRVDGDPASGPGGNQHQTQTNMQTKTNPNPINPRQPTPSGFTRHALSLLAVLALAVPATAADFVVTTDSNSAPGSLRDALLVANHTAGPHTITFNLPEHSTITLSSELVISNPQGTTIEGPGADKLTISGDGVTRIFRVTAGSSATIRGLTLKNGWVLFGDGGAIQNDGDLTLEDCRITDSGAVRGGGIYNAGTLGVDRSSFVGNWTYDGNPGGGAFPESYGGALYNVGTGVLRNSTFTGNESSAGGALMNVVAGAITLVNCTLEGNKAAVGSAIHSFWSSGTVTMSFCTVTRNTFPSGSPALNSPALYGGHYKMKNCLVGDNFYRGLTRSFGDLDSLEIEGVVLTDDDNYADQGMTVVNWADVQLGDLEDNGGPTPTLALGVGSLAINAAPDATDWDGNPVTTDQRGLPRPSGAKADIGAFEYQQTAIADTEPPVVDDLEDIVIYQTGSAATTWLVTYGATGTDNVTAPEDLEFTFDPTSGSAFALGSTPVTVTATDEAGNVSEPATFYVHVIYSDLAVQQPINADGSSVFKAGATIPVKFKFTGASAGVTDAVGALYYQRISSNTAPVNEPTTTGDPAGNSSTGFRYDANNDQYVFNWSTKGLATGTYKLFIDLNDGTTRELTLKLGK